MAAAVISAPTAVPQDRLGDTTIEGQLLETLQHQAESFDPARLPRLSPLAARLSGMDVNDIGSAREFCRLIEHEPALVARLIGLANSVAFGVPGRSFNTLEQALTRIGLHQSAQICFALLCNQAMGTALAPRWRSVLWVHALCTAATANKLAREIEICDANDAYLGGLIYDIGLMALETVRPGTLDAIAATAEAEERPMRDVEDERVGAARDHLARTLLSNWSMPARIIDAVSCRTLSVMAQDSMPAILWCADQMARSRNLVEGIYLDEAPPLPLHICTQAALPDAFYVVCSLAPAEAIKIEARVASQVQALRAMASLIAQIR
ncbi:MAG: HDOD domain-containing protein [bacterium]|jgi:HD-like signal output (HDOD) protein|nr:HDOD domain-containing protein [Rhodocyclaceae bacterium]